MNKYKKLIQNTGVFAIGNFGSKILILLLTRLYSGNLDPGNSFTKDLLETTALFLQPIFTLALQEYLIRFGLDKNYDKKKVFTTSAVITFTGMMIMVLLGIGCVLMFSNLMGESIYILVLLTIFKISILKHKFMCSVLDGKDLVWY